jgi:probable HAF family extracellular repeat protein
MSKKLICIFTVTALALADPAVQAQGSTAARLDYPGAQATFVRGIHNNGNGAVVGFYSSGGPHGFLLRNDSYMQIDVPASWNALGTNALGIADTSIKSTTYTLLDMGTLGRGSNSIPYWITESGEVVGVSETGQTDSSGNAIVHAFRYKPGGMMEDLGTLGGNNSTAFGANEEGKIVGVSDVTGGATSHAVSWHRDQITDLDTLVGSSGYSLAQLLNNRGQAVGYSQAADGTFHAVEWDHGTISDLGTLAGPNSMTFSLANGVNDRGQVVGDAQQDTTTNPLLGFPPFFPTLWQDGMAMKLGGEPSYAFAGDAFNINNRGQVVGRIAVAHPTEGAVAHAYIWDHGKMRDLGIPMGDDNSEAHSLNNKGIVVGDSGVGYILSYSPDRALLWDSREAMPAPVDLNTLIPVNSGYQLIVAFAVNDEGQIVVCAVQLSTGNVHAALLTPHDRDNDEASRAVTLSAPRAAIAEAIPSGASHSLSPQAQRLLALSRRIKTGLGTAPAN